MKRSLANEVEWEHTPVEDKGFDESRMRFLGMKPEEYAEFCSKLSIEDVAILSTHNVQKILKLKKKYGISSRR